MQWIATPSVAVFLPNYNFWVYHHPHTTVNRVKKKMWGKKRTSWNKDCLFNLKVCDITQWSRGGISCHWSGGSTFPHEYLSVRLRGWNTIYSWQVPQRSLKGPGEKARPCQNFTIILTKVWMAAKIFTGTCESVNITLLHQIVGDIDVISGFFSAESGGHFYLIAILPCFYFFFFTIISFNSSI